MKVYKIGRGTDCDIFIDEVSVSRQHALLKVYPNGKMELLDLSQNGTYVNGVRLKSNVPFPVTRKNVVKIANNRILDWKQVPDPFKYVKIGLWIILIAGVLAVSAFLIMKSGWFDSPENHYVEYPIEDVGEKRENASASKTEDGVKKVVIADTESSTVVIPNREAAKAKPEKKPEKSKTSVQKQKEGALSFESVSDIVSAYEKEKKEKKRLEEKRKAEREKNKVEKDTVKDNSFQPIL